MGQRLSDVGERELLRGLVKKHCGVAGDDCAVISVDLDSVVVTTDPVPAPAAKVIAGDEDPYWTGWLLVTINASDLAASGAEPVAFVAAVDARPDMLVSALERFLQGVEDSCEAAGLQYAGGNLREASCFSATGTAIGKCRAENALTRRGASRGDLLVSVGRAGAFWRDALTVHTGSSVDAEGSPLFMPESQIRIMHHLAGRGLVGAAMDNSDGLLPTLEELARENKLGIEIDLNLLRKCEQRGPAEIDPARLCLGWGDWNVICSVAGRNFEELRSVARRVGGQVFRLGSFGDPSESVLVRGNTAVSKAPRLESERFASDSWFSRGVDAYIKRLLTVPLPE